MNEPIPEGEKLFYTIGDVAQLLGVKTYVLRYWETEFRILNPQKTLTGQRAYRKKDIEAALTIRRLLYDEKYTIAGALKKLEELEKEGLDQLEMFLGKKAQETPPEPAVLPETAAAGLPVPPAVPEVPPASRRDPERETRLRELKGLLQSSFHILEKHGLV